MPAVKRVFQLFNWGCVRWTGLGSFTFKQVLCDIMKSAGTEKDSVNHTTCDPSVRKPLQVSELCDTWHIRHIPSLLNSADALFALYESSVILLLQVRAVIHAHDHSAVDLVYDISTPRRQLASNQRRVVILRLGHRQANASRHIPDVKPIKQFCLSWIILSSMKPLTTHGALTPQ